MDYLDEAGFSRHIASWVSTNLQSLNGSRSDLVRLPKAS